MLEICCSMIAGLSSGRNPFIFFSGMRDYLLFRVAAYFLVSIIIDLDQLSG